MNCIRKFHTQEAGEMDDDLPRNCHYGLLRLPIVSNTLDMPKPLVASLKQFPLHRSRHRIFGCILSSSSGIFEEFRHHHVLNHAGNTDTDPTGERSGFGKIDSRC